MRLPRWTSPGWARVSRLPARLHRLLLELVALVVVAVLLVTAIGAA